MRKNGFGIRKNDTNRSNTSIKASEIPWITVFLDFSVPRCKTVYWMIHYKEFQARFSKFKPNLDFSQCFRRSKRFRAPHRMYLTSRHRNPRFSPRRSSLFFQAPLSNACLLNCYSTFWDQLSYLVGFGANFHQYFTDCECFHGFIKWIFKCICLFFFEICPPRLGRCVHSCHSSSSSSLKTKNVMKKEIFEGSFRDLLGIF